MTASAKTAVAKKCQPPPPTTKSQPIHIFSTNSSYDGNAIWKCVWWSRITWFWSTKCWWKRKQLYINSYYLLEQVKKSENSFQTVSTIQFSTWEAENSLDVELLIELVRQFQLFRIQNLTVLKTTKIILLLVGVFQVFRFALLLIQCYFNIIFSFSDRVGNETWLYFSTQNFQF